VAAAEKVAVPAYGVEAVSHVTPQFPEPPCGTPSL